MCVSHVHSGTTCVTSTDLQQAVISPVLQLFIVPLFAGERSSHKEMMANTGLTMLTAILILSACGFLDVCAQGFCPENWVHWEESCYAFVDDLTSWTAAKTICLSLKADLVQIESAEENTFLTQIVQQRKAVGVWIGLDDFVQEGRWVLSSSQEVPPFVNWGPGEPNNWRAGNDDQDCGVLRPTGFWDDEYCRGSRQHLQNLICETSVREEPVIG